jgi:hypothetical protein
LSMAFRCFSAVPFDRWSSSSPQCSNASWIRVVSWMLVSGRRHRGISRPENVERRRPRSAASISTRLLDASNVLSFVAFTTLTNIEFDLLALVERLIALAGDIGVMDEYVVPALA